MIRKYTKWIDALGKVLASISIGIGMEYLNVSGETNYQKLVVQIMLMAISLLLPTLFFFKRDESIQLSRLILMTFVGLIIWLICDSILLIYYDWRYVSAHPDGIIDRHLLMFKIGLILVPIFGIIVLTFVLATRFLTGLFISFESKLK